MAPLQSNQIVIRVRAVAINPADHIVQALGVVYTEFPIVPGCDAAGEVVEVGSSVKDFQVGDRVIAMLANGAFQQYVAVTPPYVAKIPTTLPFVDAAVLPLGSVIASVCLFEDDMLHLSRPQVGRAPSNDKTVVVWGGSSSLGSCAIQLARAAGYEVAAVAGKHNFAYCRALGAEHVFDYKEEDIVEQVVRTVAGKKSVGVFCAVSGEGVVGKSARIADGLDGRKFVSVVYPPGVPIPDEIPKGVELGRSWRAPLSESKAATDIFANWLPAALSNGSMQCRPHAEVVGKGLDAIQAAVDKMGKGVSAKKLVVEIP